MAKAATITISHRALKGRINRALAPARQQVRADRRGGLVHHMLVDTKRHTIVETDVDLEQLARKLGVLQAWERAGT
jgi:hypothetical protein